jgi:hypothetical protein
MNAFDVLAWAALWWIAARYLRTGDDRLWVLFGVVAGIGLENKIDVLFLGAGLAVGLLVAGPRRAFRSRHLWIGAAIAVVLFLPHVVWQVMHGWPTREFIRNATEHKNVAFSPLGYLGAQAINMMPALPVCLAGLAGLLAAPYARRFRSLGWAFLFILAVLLSTNAKAYYLLPAYGVLFGAGGVAWERLASRSRTPLPSDSGRSKALALLILLPVFLFLLLTGALMAPFAVPVLSEDALVAYAARLGMSAPQEERQTLGRLPQHFADMHGWPEMAAAVGEVYGRLPAADRAKVCVFAQNYGEAGAIDLFGPRYGLPPAISGHNSYFLWGPRNCSGDVLIVLGDTEEGLRKVFASVERGGTSTCRDCMPYENNLPIWVCRKPKVSLAQVWPKVKHYD